jgi:hypothetical protein
MTGEDQDNQDLMDALIQLPTEGEEPLRHERGAGDLAAPEALVNAPLEPLPAGGGMGEPLPEAPAEGAGLFAYPPPGEAEGDPAESVEDMLTAAAVPEDALLDPPTSPGLDAAEQPSFRLRFAVKEEAQREALKGLAEKHALAFPDAPGADPIFSQLNEFQALALHQEALSLGLFAKASVVFPSSPAMTEEEAALGDLAAVPEGEGVIAEGAPQVSLPKHETDVLLLTEGQPSGLVLLQTLGVVTAHRSIARRFFREEEAQEKLQRELEMAAAKAPLPASRLDFLFRELFLDLQKAALSRGGNAVLGLRLQAFPESHSLDPDLEQLRLVAFGTAAVVEKAGTSL